MVWSAFTVIRLFGGGCCCPRFAVSDLILVTIFFVSN
jgi:hypothetical protein